MEREIYWLWLSSIRGMGAVKLSRLLREWPDAEAIYYESEERILEFMKKQERFREEDFLELCAAKRQMERCRREWDSLNREGVRIISVDQPDYPERLTTIPGAPPLLFVKGDWRLGQDRNTPVLAVVGTRRASLYGREAAAALGRACAEYGVTLVSGMAAGIDGIAQRECLKHGGYSIGVLGSGLGYQFPAGNRDLYLEMEERGVLISEEGYQTPPQAALFPKRNRIISGLAEAVVVVEAAEKSGSLITADYALEQGRDVYAVPGRLNDSVSSGCNRLIAQGAYLLENVERFMAEFAGRTKSDIQLPAVPEWEKDLAENEKLVYQNIGADPVYIGRLQEKSGLEPGELQLCLLQLEWKGYIQQISAGYYGLANFIL